MKRSWRRLRGPFRIAALRQISQPSPSRRSLLNNIGSPAAKTTILATTKAFRVGIISDTHGLLRPEAERALAGVDHIVHAGDIGRPEIIDALRRIAPVTAIRGNVDSGEWAREYPDTTIVRLAG